MIDLESTAKAAPTFPRWTIPSFARTSGRYPLGLEAVALDQLATVLASGLPVVSRHPRYWSIYSYILKRFWDSKRSPQTNRALGAYLKPRESIFAAAALLCPRHQNLPNGELPGIIGRDTFVPWLRNSHAADLPLNLPYLKNTLGGYGQIYRGAMSELGLIVRAEDNPRIRVDAPFGDLGAAVAEQFGASIAGTTFARRYMDQDPNTIPLDVVRELAETSCFCRLVDYPAERDLLTDVLLGRKQPHHASHAMRAHTVQMYLDIATATADTPLDESEFRRLVYFASFGSLARWQPGPSSGSIRRMWALVQLREYMVSALNALFTHFVQWGIQHGGQLYPMLLEDYAAEIERLSLTSWNMLPQGPLAQIALHQLAAALAPVVVGGGWPLDQRSLTSPLHEDALFVRYDRGRAVDAPVHALLLLLLVQQRLARADKVGQISAAEWALLRDGGIERLSCSAICQWLAHDIASGKDTLTSLVQLIRALVIRQHLRVARGKLPTKDTFRFHEHDGGFRFVDHGDDGVSSISVRFEAISGALHGLGLIQNPLNEMGHAPTDRGRVILYG